VPILDQSLVYVIHDGHCLACMHGFVMVERGSVVPPYNFDIHVPCARRTTHHSIHSSAEFGFDGTSTSLLAKGY
jgi:hypothetical protein